MTLEEKIEKEFKTAMKERAAVKVSTLRMLKADMNNVKLDKNKKTLTDEELIKIVQRQVKQHKESIEQFEKGKRGDLVEKEKQELKILEGYMPEGCSPEELRRIIEETLEELGAKSKSDFGRVVKTVMGKVKGRADGKTVSQIISGMLG